MNALSFNMMNIILAGNSSITDGDTFKEKVEAFFTSTILNWVVWGITMFFIILVVQAGVKIAMAKSPEEKTAARHKIIGITIGLGISLSASVIVTVLSSLFNGIWA